MKQYINNRNLHKPIERLGNPFPFTITLVTNINSVTNDSIAVPLFCPVMFNNLYSDVTENSFPTINKVTGNTIGVGNYFNDIWGANEFDINASLQNMFPYSGYSPTGFANFGYNYGCGLNGEMTNSVGYMGIYSQNMQYVNFLEWLKTEKFLCSNINVQINSKDPSPFINYPVGFFQQECDGRIFSISTNPSDWINPMTNTSRPINSNYSGNFDIKTDWILAKNSGVCLNYSAKVSQSNDVNDKYILNFTLQQIIK